MKADSPSAAGKERGAVDRKGRTSAVVLSTLVGAIAGFAFSPIPMSFDAEWLSWLLVPVFAALGGVLAFIHPEWSRPADVPADHNGAHRR